MNLQTHNRAGADHLTPLQCRMARAALRLGVRELAALSNVAVSTISRFEAGLKVHGRTAYDMRKALEKAGIEFDVGNGSVRLKPVKPRHPK